MAARLFFTHEFYRTEIKQAAFLAGDPVSDSEISKRAWLKASSEEINNSTRDLHSLMESDCGNEREVARICGNITILKEA